MDVKLLYRKFYFSFYFEFSSWFRVCSFRFWFFLIFFLQSSHRVNFGCSILLWINWQTNEKKSFDVDGVDGVVVNANEWIRMAKRLSPLVADTFWARVSHIAQAWYCHFEHMQFNEFVNEFICAFFSFSPSSFSQSSLACEFEMLNAYEDRVHDRITDRMFEQKAKK